MQIDVIWSAEVLVEFPELALCVGTISGIHNQKENEQLRRLKETDEEAKAKYNVEALKDNPTVRAYGDFCWKLDINFVMLYCKP